MKYLYYSLHSFYTNIVHLDESYPPIINITAVLALLQSFLIFACINTYLYISTGELIVPYHSLIPFTVFLILFWANKKYYERKEKKILAQFLKKKLVARVIINLISFLVISFIIYLWMFDGLYELTLKFLK